ncbi:protein of unknown function [Legionella fallonii LLAP-10]|uniref:Uncharacterized protein n=1 Tax=Legionella fallonii LLAP-10 TaxID=1212491 RepID=A0A098G3V3_9GAMM|nr:protein of unknown function [Legionella fallonii LLAP-10]
MFFCNSFSYMLFFTQLVEFNHILGELPAKAGIHLMLTIDGCRLSSAIRKWSNSMHQYVTTG